MVVGVTVHGGLVSIHDGQKNIYAQNFTKISRSNLLSLLISNMKLFLLESASMVVDLSFFVNVNELVSMFCFFAFWQAVFLAMDASMKRQLKIERFITLLSFQVVLYFSF